MRLSISVCGGRPIALRVPVERRDEFTVDNLVMHAIRAENEAGAEIGGSPAAEDGRPGMQIALDQFVLYVPTTGRFPFPHCTLEQAGLISGDFCKILWKTDVGEISLHRADTGATISMDVDFTEPLWRIIPSLQNEFRQARPDSRGRSHETNGTLTNVESSEILQLPISQNATVSAAREQKASLAQESGSVKGLSLLKLIKKREHLVFVVPSSADRTARFLNANLSLLESGIPHGTSLDLVPLFEVGMQASTKLGANDVFQGWLRVSQPAKRLPLALGSKWMWCIMSDMVLSCFRASRRATKPGSVPLIKKHPAVVIDVEFVFFEAGSASPEMFLRPSSQGWGGAQYAVLLEAENNESAKLWARALTRVAANGAPYRTFGVPLTALCAREMNGALPTIVRTCIEILSQYGLKSPGLFRISGDHEVIISWCDLLDSGNTVRAIEDMQRRRDVNSVAGLLKKFLRELPEPIVVGSPCGSELCQNSRCELLGAVRSNDIATVSSLIRKLPIENQRVLKALLTLFRQVVDQVEYNRMGIEPLSLVVSPSLIQGPSTGSKHSDNEGKPIDIISDMRAAHEVTTFLIENLSSLTFQTRQDPRKSTSLPSQKTVLAVSSSLLGPPAALFASRTFSRVSDSMSDSHHDFSISCNDCILESSAEE